MPILKHDIKAGRNGIIYGTAGEEVKIISEHQCVVIVEGKSGKFPVHSEELTDDIKDIEKSQVVEEDSFPGKKTRSSKSKPIQTNLF